MALERIQRRLAAILAADIVGFSTLVGRDEAGTLRAFKGHMASLEPIIGINGGRVVKYTGDGFLAEFPSVVDAVACAAAMQRQMAERNRNEPPERLVIFRMGVHVGDIVVDGDDIVGDGVNVAARLESVAPSGGIAISARVFDDVENKLDLEFVDAGLQELKNISRPLRVYEITTASQAPTYMVPDRPDKPSLAVLPFENMSVDGDQEYFADGLSEDLIAALSHVPWIFVIARNSSFTYKGLTLDVRKIGAQLGVRYVLEGSVRRAGNRVRVTAELIDTETGNHIWADKFDGILEDIFELQDTITREVVATIAPRIETAEIARSSLKRPNSLSAYDHYLRARAALNNLQIAEAAALLEKALAISADYSKAKAVRAWCYTLYGWRDILAVEDDRDTAIRLANEALASPNADSETAAYAGYTIAFMRSAVERGMRLVEEATARCPSFAWAWASQALLEVYYRDPVRAIELAKIALRLNPRDPQSFRAEMAITGAYYNLDQFEPCLKYCEQSLSKAPDIQFFVVYKIDCLVQMNRLEEARAVARRFIERHPNFTASRWGALTRSSPDASKISRMKEALRKAGLPD